MVLYAAFGKWMTTLHASLAVNRNSSPSVNMRVKKKKKKNSKIYNLQQMKEGGVHYNSLKLLEWDKLCDSVSSFAGTSLGRQAIKVQLWSLNRNYEECLMLLRETNSAVEMHKHGSCRLDFSGIDLLLVKSGIEHARRALLVSANEAIAIATMLEYADILQLNLQAAINEDAGWYNRFVPLSQLIMELVINRPLVRMIHQVIDEDGSVKDSASSALKRSRDQVQILEKKLYQLMDSLIKNDVEESFLEVCNVKGRWCIKSGTNQLMKFKGLLLPSDSGAGSILEPLTAVPLNDELQRARESVAKAEADVLLMLTEKMQKDLDGIEKLLDDLIQLDIQKLQGDNGMSRGETDLDSSSSEIKVSALEQAHPVPVDFLIAQNSRVLVITGPNTGGKTICLKTVGLAAMMAKSGLYVLCSESVQLPWFDYILADIGDEQSLSQSLSTFSGHLKQISDIRSQSTNRSLVLLDEVGAGTNPLEGAALGMSLLESFAEDGALLTIATTHHSELKSLKYSNSAFENACMEFDEVNLKPTYKIIWGVPGRSNAINISEKLGLPDRVINIARELYGAASAEINEVIIDMERFKQEVQELLYEAQHQIRYAFIAYSICFP
ncbi:endonuclease MutS2 isoform X3 [Ricinus communis]|uniref:endonuclease MutS2 isoform X3 n=1 Tax=Ricinus communis TaxID=3988 RepID=UPI00201ACBD1|nr:endonuclease MutS2 isoform X3 [Ricinus communis]